MFWTTCRLRLNISSFPYDLPSHRSSNQRIPQLISENLAPKPRARSQSSQWQFLKRPSTIPSPAQARPLCLALFLAAAAAQPWQKADPAIRAPGHGEGVLLMSSGGTVPFSAAGADDDVECRACYGVVVTCFHGRRPQGRRRHRHRRAALRRDRLACSRRGLDAAAVRHGRAAAGCACRLVGAAPGDVPAAFAYECGPADAEVGGKPGGGALCAVCLEDVRRDEAVRRLPACGHLFHKDCVDMLLHAHTTCPLCRCDLVPRACAAKTVTAATAQSSRDVLPPV
ncbi:hypothetical protein C2845_PM11G19130 [Panicum miliaceum]|uniref:RING-type E3 ubiquitin transferase n=1 Tax=Panicum miliaceum TaxID=4540 RepID=A0A3L6RRI4_PANMI|nr:hypothetical protein C2845_PM11G19130 [Panicum miliaceum]